MKRIFTLLAFCVSCIVADGQSLKDLFLGMPQQLCPSLSEYNRLEIVDNQRNGKAMKTRNLLKSVSEMKMLTDQYAHLVISQSSEKEMLLLTKGDSSTQIIMIVSTVWSDSIADSSVSFYTTDWQPLLAADYMDEPISDDFRRISVNPSTLQMTISTSQPLVLQTDGSENPARTSETVCQTFIWNSERNKFVLHAVL